MSLSGPTSSGTAVCACSMRVVCTHLRLVWWCGWAAAPESPFFHLITHLSVWFMNECYDHESYTCDRHCNTTTPRATLHAMAPTPPAKPQFRPHTRARSCHVLLRAGGLPSLLALCPSPLWHARQNRQLHATQWPTAGLLCRRRSPLLSLSHVLYL